VVQQKTHRKLKNRVIVVGAVVELVLCVHHISLNRLVWTHIWKLLNTKLEGTKICQLLIEIGRLFVEDFKEIEDKI
jgi:hypothetical protein